MNTQDEILASLDLGLGDDTEAAQQPQGNYYGNLARTFAGQGFALGLGDELEAGFRSAMSKFTDEPRAYKEIRDEVRKEIKRFQTDNPGVAITAEVVGGLLPTAVAIVTGVGAPAGVANASRLTALAKRVSRAAPVGATAGYGYSESDTIGGQTLDTTTGAITAVAASEALRKVGQGVGMGYGALQTALRNRFGNQYAGKVTEYLNKLRERTGKTIDETVDDVRNGGVMAEDDALPASLRGIASEGGEAAGDIKIAAKSRVDQTMGQARDEVRTALAPGVSGTNVALAQKRANQELKDYQGDEYGAIYADAPKLAEPVKQKMFGQLRVNTRLRRSMEELYEAEAGNNPNLKPLFGDKVDPKTGKTYFAFIREPTLKDAEQVRRILKEMESNKYAGSNPSPAIAVELGETESVLRKAIDKASPRLAVNRENYSAREAFNAAFKLGKQSQGASSDDLANILDDLNPDEIKAFRAGYYQTVKRALSDRKGSFPAQAGGLNRAKSGPNEIMKTILPEDQADSAIASLARAGRAQQNNTAIKPAGNSMTQFTNEATKEMGAVGKVAAISEALAMPTPGNVSRAAVALTPEDLGLNNQQKRKVVEILFSENPDLVRAALTDETAFGVLNQKVISIANGLMQGADNVVQRQAPAGLIENL